MNPIPKTNTSIIILFFRDVKAYPTHYPLCIEAYIIYWKKM